VRKTTFGAMILWLLLLADVAHAVPISIGSAEEPELVIQEPSPNDLNFLLADLDGDGFVGGTDFILLRGCYLGAQLDVCGVADFDGDSSIGESDVAFFRAAFSGVPVSSIPEPGTLLLAGAGLVALSGFRLRV